MSLHSCIYFSALQTLLFPAGNTHTRTHTYCEYEAWRVQGFLIRWQGTDQCVFPPVRFDQNSGCGLLPEAVASTSGTSGELLSLIWPPSPHPIQEIHTSTDQQRQKQEVNWAKDGQQKRFSSPVSADGSKGVPAYSQSWRHTAETALLWKTEEMYVRTFSFQPHLQSL